MSAKANTKIDSKAAHVSALVAFAPNGGTLKDAFDWIPVEAEADIASIFYAARRKAGAFMSLNQAETSTCFIVEITQQWDAEGKAL